jgi:hypothetical protein
MALVCCDGVLLGRRKGRRWAGLSFSLPLGGTAMHGISGKRGKTDTFVVKEW